MFWRCLAALVLLLAAGCDRETRPELDPNYHEPMVTGYLDRMELYDGSVYYERDVYVFDNLGLRMVPLVTLNNEELPCYYYTWTGYAYGDEKKFRVHSRYELEVTHYWGTAFSRIIMPGNFGLTYPPDDEYVLDMESTLVVTWRRSEGAQWYWVDAYCYYDYVDSFYHLGDHDFELDTTVCDTCLVLSPGRIFPGYVMDVLEGDGAVMVWAGYGPTIEPGDYGNVRGNGYGFFNGYNEAREKYFWVGAPIDCRRSPGAMESREKLHAHLRRRASQATK